MEKTRRGKNRQRKHVILIKSVVKQIIYFVFAGSWWKAITVFKGKQFLYEANWVQDSSRDNTRNLMYKDMAQVGFQISITMQHR